MGPLHVNDELEGKRSLLLVQNGMMMSQGAASDGGPLGVTVAFQVSRTMIVDMSFSSDSLTVRVESDWGSAEYLSVCSVSRQPDHNTAKRVWRVKAQNADSFGAFTTLAYSISVHQGT